MNVILGLRNMSYVLGKYQNVDERSGVKIKIRQWSKRTFITPDEKGSKEVCTNIPCVRGGFCPQGIYIQPNFPLST